MRTASIISGWFVPAPSADGRIVHGRSPCGFLRSIHQPRNAHVHHLRPQCPHRFFLQPHRQPGLARRIAPSLLAFALGVALIYGAGFASKVELHNAAHDGRHSAGFLPLRSGR
jgi:cobalt transporter subunit CbtB